MLRIRKVISMMVVISLITTFIIFANGSSRVLALGSISNDTINKILTVGCTNLVLNIDYNNKCKMTSLKVNNIETLDTQGVVSAVEVPRGSTAISTAMLSSSPTVSINGLVVTISGISYQNSYIKVTETWTVTSNSNNIPVQVSKTYTWLNGTYSNVDMKTLGWTFKQDIFDTAYRGDGGSLTLKSPADGTTLRQLTPTDKYKDEQGVGYIGGDIDLVNNTNNFILSLAYTSSRNMASEIYRNSNSPYSLKLDHKVSSSSFAHSLHNPSNSVDYHLFDPASSTLNNQHAYDPISISNSQNDISTCTISAALNRDKYYGIGYFPSSSGIDQTNFARFLTEFGRTSTVDLLGSGGAWNSLRLEYSGLMESQWAPDEMLALQVSSANAICLEALKKTVETGIAVQDSYGHILGCAGGQPYSYPQTSEADEGVPLCAAAYINAKNDTVWANSVKTGVRKALDYRLSKDTDNDGLVEDYYATNTGSNMQGWLDQLYQGGEDGYINALLYGALVQWADIEQNVIGDTAEATYYKDKAARLKDTYNKDLINGGLWSNTYQGFIGWRNMDGTMKGDVKYLWVDSAAIKYGLANGTRSKQILEKPFDNNSSLGDWMTNNGNVKAYPLNLYDLDNTEMNESPDFNGTSFPTWENGEVFPHVTGEMISAYARLGSSLPVKYMKNLLNLYYTSGDPMWWKDVYDWQLGTNIWGCNTRMAVNMHSAATFITDILGLKPKYDCLEVNPVIDDSNFYNTEINYSMRGHTYRIKFDNSQKRTLMQNDGAVPVRFKWNNLVPGNSYNINYDGTNYARKADTDGIVSYDITAAGSHTVEINVNTPPADTNIISYRATEGYSSTQGMGNWSYQYLNGSIFYNMTWNSAGKYWIGDTTYSMISGGWQHPDTNRPSARVFTCPTTGTVKVTGYVRLKQNGGNGVNVKIMKNAQAWWPTSGYQLINNIIGVSFDGTVAVNAGDQLQFVVDNNGDTNYDQTMWSPQIAYIEQHNATTEFSSTQGSSNWYYKEYTGGTLASTGMINNMTWDAGAGRWIGSSTYSLVGNNWQHPDASNQSVRVYKAPKDGFIEVKSNGNVRLQAAGSDGVYVQVKNNNTVVWPSGGGYGGGWSLITDTSGVAMSFVTYVNKDDEIFFVVDKNSSISNDTILLEPLITFIQ